MITHFEEAATPPEISCRVVIQFLLYFRSCYGLDRLELAVEKLNSPYSLEYLFEPRNFVSFEFATLLLDGLSEESGDPEFARQSGAFFSSPESLGFVYFMFRALGSPRIAYSKSVELGRTYNRAGDFHIESLSAHHLRLRYRSHHPEPNRNLCEARMGQLASFPTIWNLPEAEIEEHRCQVEGAESCLYELKWEPMDTPFLRVILGAVLASAALYFADQSLLATLLAGGMGAALGLVWSLTRRLRSQGKVLARQAEAMALSMRDLQARFEEVQQLNSTLETKVEERTRELQRAGEQLQLSLARQVELDEAKTRFFQNISHELRTPLTLILTPIESLLHSAGLSERQRNSLELVQRAAGRLLSLINSLLDLARLDGIEQRLTLSPVDPAQLVRQLAESALPHAKKRGIDLRLQIPESLEPIPLDVDKVEKICMNLISNALKFTGIKPEGPSQVDIQVVREAEELKVTVSDTGIGIPADDLPHLFERFHQVSAGKGHVATGTGIGLSLVKELVEFHGGQVEVSSALNQGSTFTITLPTQLSAYPPERLAPVQESLKSIEDRSFEQQQKLASLLAGSRSVKAPATRQAQSPREHEDNRPRVLIVDDSPDMLSFLANIFSDEFELRTASDGEQALKLAVEDVPDLIISDVMMPRLSGTELVSALREDPRTRTIPVLLLTARADSESKVEGLDQGADDYLVKPFNFLELRARVHRLLQRKDEERKLAELNRLLSKANTSLTLAQKAVFFEAMEALAAALEAKDAHTHGHSQRVATLSLGIGEQLGLEAEELERLRMAAILHDIGKLGIPASTLEKAEPLNEPEWEQIKQHPLVGFQILSSVKGLADVAKAILHHHERFDGSGYPSNLAGTDIPLHARIISVADAYDAMTSSRAYRSKVSHEEALAELRRCSDTHFDALCVDAFSTRFGIKPPPLPAKAKTSLEQQDLESPNGEKASKESSVD